MHLFGPSIFALGLIFLGAEVESYKDFSEAESLLLHYYNYGGTLKWKWSVKAFCRFICPGTLRVEDEFTYVEERTIMLESADCQTIDADMLTCGCETVKSDREDEVQMFDWISLINGLNGEIYRVEPPTQTECNDEKSFVLCGEVVHDVNLPKWPLPLAGVGQIFEKFMQKRLTALYTAGTQSGYQSDSEDE